MKKFLKLAVMALVGAVFTQATAESDGELVFQFARDGGKPAQFYQIVVE